MLSFYPSAAHSHFSSSLHTARPVYSNEIVHLHPSISDNLYHPRTTSPESRYRRALAEYLAAEEELSHIREESALRARVEALQRQEEARFLQARIIRAREERRARQLEQVIAQQRATALTAKTATPEAHLSLPHTVPIAYSNSEQCRTSIPSAFATQTPQTYVSFMDGSQLPDSVSVNEVCCMCVLSTDSPDGPNQVRSEHRSAPHLVPENRISVPTLESLLQARLRKVARDNEDEELQDLARATLRHLVQDTLERNGNDTSAPSFEVGFNYAFTLIFLSLTSIWQTKLDGMMPALEGTDLSRSDALQGTAAEAAKASFKAYRAAATEQADLLASKTAVAPLETIQNIRATLSKLSADFSIPSTLDFSDDEADGLAYTPTNAPIRVYEHALEGLLAQLDGVESDGDEEVRMARRTVVKEVEMALEGVEKKVKNAREVAKDHDKTSEGVLTEATASSSDLVADEDTHAHAEFVARVKTEEEEDSSLMPGHATVAYNSSLGPVSAPEVDAASYAADSADVAPDVIAIEDKSPAFPEESTEAVAALASSTRPASVQDEVPRAYISSDVPELAYSATTEQSIPAHEFPISTTSETSEDAYSLSPEGFVFTPSPVSPTFASPDLPEYVSASRMSALSESEGEISGSDEADNEDEWSEVEA